MRESNMMSWFAALAVACVLSLCTTQARAQNAGYVRFDQTSDVIRIYGNTVHNEGDYTYEMRIRLAPGAAIGQVISEQRDSFEDKTILLGADGSYSVSACLESHPSGVPQPFAGTLADFPSNAWLHFAYVHTGGTIRLYVNGVLRVTGVPIGCYGDRPDSVMALGMFQNGAGCCPGPVLPSFLGDLDWIRVSAGARYTANEFTPPFECEVFADAQTELLLRFNEDAGTTTLTDESSSHFVCELGVPVSPLLQGTLPTLGLPEGGYAACACFVDSDGDGVGDCDDACPNDPTTTTGLDYYIDADFDGYGAGVATASCTPIAGFVTNNTDCNDGNASIYPGAPELCDGIDNNCDGQTDELPVHRCYLDLDGDGFPSQTEFVLTCDPNVCPPPWIFDCDDSNPAVNLPTVWYLDVDHDGVGVAESAVTSCVQPTGYAATFGDGCPTDPLKLTPGVCGCGSADLDVDGDGRIDCLDVELRMDLISGPPVLGGELRVRVSAVTLQPIVQLLGLHCAMRYDAEWLEFVDAVPVVGGAFPLEIAQVTPNPGELLFALGGLPPAGLVGSSPLFDLVFTVRMEERECAHDVQLVRFDQINGWNAVFTTADQIAVIPSLVSLAPLDLDFAPPTLVGVLASIAIPADAGNAAGAVVTEPLVTATDACTQATVALLITLPSGQALNHWPDGGVFPIGVSTVHWEATDAVGNMTVADRTVEVWNYQLFDATFELVGAFDPDFPPFTRTIRLTVGALSNLVVVPFAPSPGNPTHRVGALSGIQVPVTATAPCALAKDVAHSLTDLGATTIVGTRYASSFTLLQGDSNEDDAVDIFDFGIWYIDFGDAAADGRSNFNSDSVVSNADFTWIAMHFFLRGESCGGGFTGAAPVERVSVKELRRRGLGALVKADLDHNGWLDRRDFGLSPGVAEQSPDEVQRPR